MERIHRGPDNEGVRRLLFDDLEVIPATRRERAKVVSQQPRRDVVRLMHSFANSAFRRPVEDEVLKPYVALALASLDNGDDFVAAMRAGYRDLLCSPRFLYFHEQPGNLDNYAVASRLSYLLWNRMPDKTLFDLARSAHGQVPGQSHSVPFVGAEQRWQQQPFLYRERCDDSG